MSVLPKNIEASYLVFLDGARYKAKDGASNVVEHNDADASTVIQAALDDLASGGKVYLRRGIYDIVTTITMNQEYQELWGDGKSTLLVANDDLDDDVINMTGAAKWHQAVRDLMIDGNAANQASGSGVKIDQTYGTTDSHAILDNLYIYDVKEYGVEIDGADGSREVELDRVHVKFAGNDGFKLNGTDHKISGCVSEQVVGMGFNLTCGNAQLVMCKSFGAGSDVRDGTPTNDEPGFGIYTDRAMLTNCQAQDNAGEGFEIYGAQNNLLVGCQADTNGKLDGATDRAGFNLDGAGCDFNVLAGCTAFDRGAGTQLYGLWIGAAGPPEDNNCDVTCDGTNATKDIYIESARNVVTGGGPDWTYQIIAGAGAADPSGDPYDGRIVSQYNTGGAASLIYTYINGAWVGK